MMTRREALSTMGKSSLAVAAIGIGQSASAETAKAVKKAISPDQPIRIAVIGAKNQGGRVHLPSLVGDDDCLVATICDVDKNVVAESIKMATDLYAEKGKKVKIKASYDYRDVMADKSIDAVLIATPDHWHVPLSKAAVLAGKDVYVEKPLSFYVTEGRELVDLVKDRDIIVQVGSQHRSMDRIFLAQAAIQAGLIGKVHHVDVEIKTRSGELREWEPQPVPPELDYDMYVGPATWTDYHVDRVHYNFRFVPEFSGGEIANWGAHFLDSFQQIMELDDTGPVKVHGKGKRHPAGNIHTSNYDIDVDFTYPCGLTMKFKTGDNGITFHGDKGSLFVSRKKLTMDPPELLRSIPKDKALAMKKTKGSHLQNWFACVRSRRKEDLHAPLWIGNRSANLCHLANIAIELGRPLEWDDEKEVFRNDAMASSLLNRPVREKWRV
ncbi:MAG: Gfo/Idh/MocA family protein [Puniceicoccaceae bacterium]